MLTGRLVDYGVVRWQYWVPGLLVSMLTETLIVGAATGFNPVAMAATAASELLTDVPVWRVHRGMGAASCPPQSGSVGSSKMC